MFRAKAKSFLAGFWAVCLIATSAGAAAVEDYQLAAQLQTSVSKYCVGCHSERLKTSGLSLEKLDAQNVPASAAVWEKVIRKLRARQMPPAGLPRPDESTYVSLANYLEATIDQAAETQPNPGRTVGMRRLNRTEYANAVRDLLALDVDARSLLPPDDAANGFDNIGDALTVSPVLLERYMAAAVKISRQALGDQSMKPATETYEVPRLLRQDERVSDELPFGSRGGTSIRHFFPLDGEYQIKVRLQRDALGDIVGITDPKQVEIRIDDALVRQFSVGGELSKFDDPGQGYARTADDGMEFTVPVKAGPRTLAATFRRSSVKQEGAVRERPRGDAFEGIGSVAITGPLKATGVGNTPSRGKIFSCYPKGREDEPICARQILGKLSRQAYRRPVTEDDVKSLFALYESGRKKGSFEAGIQVALEGMLASPGFIFRTEHDLVGAKPAQGYAISDLELATRLAQFLWSSTPDNELIELAAQGKLKDSATLEKQVRRMLADPKSAALVKNFAGQWLYLRNMRTKYPDGIIYPEFDENLREAMIRQSEMFFESILREDRSVVDLLDADYTFLNERLARHYQIPGVYGNRFRRVPVQDDNRRGILGQGAILTVTSYATRTAPTLRGKWLLENILGTPPPPPPPNVPSLKEDSNTKTLTMRQRMEQHRANPVCATCHQMMDPLGFALENFDAIGRWRVTEAGKPIEAGGVMPDGAQFNGPGELRKILLGRKEQFVRTVTEKLLTYALGRGIEYYDYPAVRRIMRESEPGGYRWTALTLAIVRSTPFQMRRAQEP